MVTPKIVLLSSEKNILFINYKKMRKYKIITTNTFPLFRGIVHPKRKDVLFIHHNQGSKPV